MLTSRDPASELHTLAQSKPASTARCALAATVGAAGGATVVGAAAAGGVVGAGGAAVLTSRY